MSNVEKKKGFPWAIAIGGAILCSFLYVGSIGPIKWLFNRGYLPSQWEPALDWVYWPLAILYRNVELFRMFLEWYVGLFIK